MAIEADRSMFDTAKLPVDGGKFKDCIFNGTILIYSGGAFPKFDQCTFNGTSWIFDGPAKNTIEFLRSLYLSGGFRPVVDDIIKLITSEHDLPKEN